MCRTPETATTQSTNRLGGFYHYDLCSCLDVFADVLFLLENNVGISLVQLTPMKKLSFLRWSSLSTWRFSFFSMRDWLIDLYLSILPKIRFRHRHFLGRRNPLNFQSNSLKHAIFLRKYYYFFKQRMLIAMLQWNAWEYLFSDSENMFYMTT